MTGGREHQGTASAEWILSSAKCSGGLSSGRDARETCGLEALESYRLGLAVST